MLMNTLIDCDGIYVKSGLSMQLALIHTLTECIGLEIDLVKSLTVRTAHAHVHTHRLRWTIC